MYIIIEEEEKRRKRSPNTLHPNSTYNTPHVTKLVIEEEEKIPVPYTTSKQYIHVCND